MKLETYGGTESFLLKKKNRNVNSENFLSSQKKILLHTTKLDRSNKITANNNFLKR